MFRRRTKVARISEIPSGLCIRTQAGLFYSSKGQRYKFISQRSFDSWNVSPYECDEDALKMPVVGRVGFRSGTWAKSFVDSKTFLISDNKKRLVTNPDILSDFKVDHTRLMFLSQAELDFHEDGAPLG